MLDLNQFVQCHFFSGIAGWSHALDLAGWPRTRPVWSASLPCQSFSCAGDQLGFADERGQLWNPFYSLVCEYLPGVIFGEQVEAAIRFGWIDRVFSDLEAKGYACWFTVLGAHSAGAPHQRQRIYWVAVRHDMLRRGEFEPGKQIRIGRAELTGGRSDCTMELTAGSEQRSGPGEQSRAEPENSAERRGLDAWNDYAVVHCTDGKARRISGRPQSGTQPVDDGLPTDVDAGWRLGDGSIWPLAKGETMSRTRVGLLRGAGNAICAQTAARFITSVMEALE